MVCNEKVFDHHQEIELDKEISQIVQGRQHSRMLVGHFLLISLKSFRLSLSYFRTSATALRSYLLSFPKIVILRVRDYLVCR